MIPHSNLCSSLSYPPVHRCSAEPVPAGISPVTHPPSREKNLSDRWGGGHVTVRGHACSVLSPVTELQGHCCLWSYQPTLRLCLTPSPAGYEYGNDGYIAYLSFRWDVQVFLWKKLEQVSIDLSVYSTVVITLGHLQVFPQWCHCTGTFTNVPSVMSLHRDVYLLWLVLVVFALW